MTFAAEVRDELAHVPLAADDDAARLAEAVVGVRVAGTLLLGRGAPGVSITTGSGAVARRLRAGVIAVTGFRPRIEVHPAQGMAVRARYRLVWPSSGSAADSVLQRLGLLDPQGRLWDGLPARPVHAAPAAALRGALMVAGSISGPGQPPHLEIAAPGQRTAADLAALLRTLGAPGARAGAHGDGWRAVVKSGAGIAALLAGVGAHSAFLRYDQGRLHSDLRADANRAANADGANLQRTVAAAGRHLEVVESALRVRPVHELPPELAAVALARIANPQASLAELGALLDPPVGKVTVHRRLARLQQLAASEAGASTGSGRPETPG